MEWAEQVAEQIKFVGVSFARKLNIDHSSQSALSSAKLSKRCLRNRLESVSGVDFLLDT